MAHLVVHPLRPTFLPFMDLVKAVCGPRPPFSEEEPRLEAFQRVGHRFSIDSNLRPQIGWLRLYSMHAK